MLELASIRVVSANRPRVVRRDLVQNHFERIHLYLRARSKPDRTLTNRTHLHRDTLELLLTDGRANRAPAAAESES